MAGLEVWKTSQLSQGTKGCWAPLSWKWAPTSRLCTPRRRSISRPWTSFPTLLTRCGSWSSRKTFWKPSVASFSSKKQLRTTWTICLKATSTTFGGSWIHWARKSCSWRWSLTTCKGWWRTSRISRRRRSKSMKTWRMTLSSPRRM